MIDRRHFLEAAALAGAAGTLFPGALYARHIRDSGGGPGVARVCDPESRRLPATGAISPRERPLSSAFFGVPVNIVLR